MDLIGIAEDNALASFFIILTVGLIQGLILGRGIRKKFPKLKKHAKAVSIILLILFSINAVFSVMKFATPEKITLSEIHLPLTLEEWFGFLINFLGLNAGFGTVMAVFVSISLILFFKFAQIPKVAKYFIFTISVIMLAVSLLGRFSDYVPTAFQIMLYVFYQFGLTIGIFFVTRRKIDEENYA